MLSAALHLYTKHYRISGDKQQELLANAKLRRLRFASVCHLEQFAWRTSDSTQMNQAYWAMQFENSFEIHSVYRYLLA